MTAAASRDDIEQASKVGGSVSVAFAADVGGRNVQRVTHNDGPGVTVIVRLPSAGDDGWLIRSVCCQGRSSRRARGVTRPVSNETLAVVGEANSCSSSAPGSAFRVHPTSSSWTSNWLRRRHRGLPGTRRADACVRVILLSAFWDDALLLGVAGRRLRLPAQTGGTSPREDSTAPRESIPTPLSSELWRGCEEPGATRTCPMAWK